MSHVLPLDLQSCHESLASLETLDAYGANLVVAAQEREVDFVLASRKT